MLVLPVILSVLATTGSAAQPAQICEAQAAWIADQQTRGGYTAPALILDHFGPRMPPIQNEPGAAEPHLLATDDGRVEFSELVPANRYREYRRELNAGLQELYDSNGPHPAWFDTPVKQTRQVDDNVRERLGLAPQGNITVSMSGWRELATITNSPSCSITDLGNVEFVSDPSQVIRPDIRSFSEAENRAGALHYPAGDAPNYFEYQVYAFTYFAISANGTEAILGVEISLAGEGLYYLSRDPAGNWMVLGERSLVMY